MMHNFGVRCGSGWWMGMFLILVTVCVLNAGSVMAEGGLLGDDEPMSEKSPEPTVVRESPPAESEKADSKGVDVPKIEETRNLNDEEVIEAKPPVDPAAPVEVKEPIKEESKVDPAANEERFEEPVQRETPAEGSREERRREIGDDAPRPERTPGGGDPDEFSTDRLRNDRMRDDLNERRDSPSGQMNPAAEEAARTFRYSYKGRGGVFHLTEEIGTAHYRLENGSRYLVILRRPNRGDRNQSFDLPERCDNFLYYIQDPKCGDPRVRAWAFSRRPTGARGFVVMKLIGKQWVLHTCCLRDGLCGSEPGGSGSAGGCPLGCLGTGATSGYPGGGYPGGGFPGGGFSRGGMNLPVDDSLMEDGLEFTDDAYGF